MHVDAFFEYCLGHSHPYYMQIPQSNASVSESRDGVPLEEDLALRALVPQWKPKRGRKRAGDREEDGGSAVKRPQLDGDGALQSGTVPASSAGFPQSAIPFSAFPDDMEPNDPWIAATSSFGANGSTNGRQQGQELRWKPFERDASPTGYPQSAIVSGGHPSSDALPSAEPRSAVTPSSGDKPRSRRRHGPAVSSAWLSNNGSSRGKTRGRPPNKGTVSGPFSSFPVNPNRNRPPPSQKSNPQSPPRIIFHNESQYQESPTPFPSNNFRPNKLQLQVPQHSGGPVRLATPPAFIGGNKDASGRPRAEAAQANGTTAVNGPPTAPKMSPHPDTANSSLSSLTVEDFVRVLSMELLGGKLIGRSSPLSIEEARAIAWSVLTNFTSLHSRSSMGSPLLTTALHLGLGHHFGMAQVAPGLMTVTVKSTPASAANGHAPGVYTVSSEYCLPTHITTKVTCADIRIGHVSSSQAEEFKTPDEMNNNVRASDETGDVDFGDEFADNDVDEGTWKQRCLKLRAQLTKKDRALSQYKRRILESVMADI